MLNLEIRYITKSDNRTAISKVYEESWKYAYKNIVPQDYLDRISQGQWASHIEQEDRKIWSWFRMGLLLVHQVLVNHEWQK